MINIGELVLVKDDPHAHLVEASRDPGSGFGIALPPGNKKEARAHR